MTENKQELLLAIELPHLFRSDFYDFGLLYPFL